MCLHCWASNALVVRTKGRMQPLCFSAVIFRAETGVFSSQSQEGSIKTWSWDTQSPSVVHARIGWKHANAAETALK